MDHNHTQPAEDAVLTERPMAELLAHVYGLGYRAGAHDAWALCHANDQADEDGEGMP